MYKVEIVGDFSRIGHNVSSMNRTVYSHAAYLRLFGHAPRVLYVGGPCNMCGAFGGCSVCC